MIQTLLDSVADFVNKKSNSPNFFSLIGQETREMTHSSFIASLLDPNGAHKQGELFLRTFINTLVPWRSDEIDYNSVTVEVEKDMGPEGTMIIDGKEEPIGGRIDIFIKDKKEYVIVIENKIFANDQDKQLNRYWNSTRDASHREIIYLTLDGHQPTEKSLGNLSIEAVDCKSYNKDITTWIRECLVAINNHALRLILNQYIETINKLTADLEVIELMTKSSEYIKASLAISSCIENARQRVMEEFMLRLQICFTDKGAIGFFDKLYQDREGWHFKFRQLGLKIELCIAWRLFIRVEIETENQLEDRKNQLIASVLANKHNWSESGGSSNKSAWRYIDVDGQNIDFHNFSKPALKYLDNPDKIVEKAFNRIQDIIEKELLPFTASTQS